MAHGLVESHRPLPFPLRPRERWTTTSLFSAGYNRVYDSLEPETNLDHVEEVVDHILEEWDEEDIVCSLEGCTAAIGEYSAQEVLRGGESSRSAYEHKRPVFCSRAFSDSEWASTFALNKFARQRDRPPSCGCSTRLKTFEKFADTMLATKTHGHCSPSAAAFRATGRKQFGVYAELMARQGLQEIAAASATTTACGSVPSRCTGAV
jgi:deoxyhypusine synthase